LSTAIDALISRMIAAGPPEKRPPHIWLEVCLRLIVCLLALAALAACDRQKPAPAQETSETDVPGDEKGVDRSHAGTPAPDAVFQNPDGGAFTLAKARGVPTLVNLWATWCAPCVKELPTLQKLDERQAVDGGLGVMIVSQDMAPKASVEAFLKSKDIALRSFLDPEMKLGGALGVQIMPTTILYDAEGKEVWRYVGDLDWTGPEAAGLLAEAKPKA
jgi:thiol-disulfide isomerase/thioredoxin